MDDPDRDPTIEDVRQAAREAAEADTAERARRQEQRDEVTARAQAAGWPTGTAAMVYPTVVVVALLAYEFLGPGAGPVGFTFTSLAPFGLLPPIVFILLDLHRGPLDKAQRDNPRTGPRLAALVGGVAGVAAGAAVQAISANDRGCEARVIGDCGFGLILIVAIVGPFLAVAVTAAVLALMRVRHAFFIALLGAAASALLVGAVELIPSGLSEYIVVLSTVIGAVGYALAGVGLARRLSPTLRSTALAVIVLFPLAALALHQVLS